MIRKAQIKDADKIHRLINSFAKLDLMMPRSLNEIYENIRDFWVSLDKNNKLIGCVALHIVGWDNLAEIRSLAVEKKYQKKGEGRLLIQACLEEAVDLHIDRVFALSYKPKFFKKFGFKRVKNASLPHKIWAECINCCKFPNCQEIALLKIL